jgi:threonylcarbamoyladenosine tRNA methylthiotransferase MtaB
MRTFSISTLGCKVNQYESQQVRELLERFGLRHVENTESGADLFIVNTCCVTSTASAKSRQFIRRARKQSPNGTIVVSGCLAAVKTGELRSTGKRVYVIKNREKLASELAQILAEQKFAAKSKAPQKAPYTLINAEAAANPENKCILAERADKGKQKKDLFGFGEGADRVGGLRGLNEFSGHTRAFLKVQDGCDGVCSYCIVPRARPNVTSRDADEIVGEAQRLVAAGHQEVVVTGVFLGAYGQQTVCRRKWKGGENPRLAELLEKLARVEGLARIRLSSLEPGDVTERLLGVMRSNHNIMPHLHLSLQSGSEKILRRMCRQYTAAEYLEKVAMANERLDRPAITTDVIVGFPGETEGDFADTVHLARRAGFAKMHIFPFSARAGTAAAKMQGVVNTGVMTRRCRELAQVEKELGTAFRRQFEGEEAAVLVETVGKDGTAKGRAERYFEVEIRGQRVERNALVRVKLGG